MNRFALLVAMVAALAFGFASPAFAGGPCDGPNPPFFCGPQDPPEPEPPSTQGGGSNVNTNTNTANGGSSDVGNGFGNFSPTAFSGGGDASATGGNATGGAGGDGFGLGVAGAGVFGSGNSEIGDVGNNSGNSSSDSSASAFGAQGQQQGQVGIQGQLGILDNTNDIDNGNTIDTDTSTSTSTKTKQGQDQTAVGKVKVDSHDEVTVEGDDIVYEAPDIPVNSAAPVFAGACSQGVSVQTQSFGGSAGTTNPVCDYVAVAGGFIAAGDRDDALRVLGKAEDAADWRYRFSQIRSVLTLGLL
jgi:hypothetical protein